MISYFLPAFFLILGLAALTAGGSALYVRHSARRDAEDVYRVRQDEAPGSLKGLSLERFRDAYLRAHGARSQIFLGLAMAAALAASPVALAVLRYGWRFFWARSGYPEFYAEGVLIWHFYMFFGLITVWALVAAYVARRYHANVGGSLEEEIIREAANARRSEKE